MGNFQIFHLIFFELSLFPSRDFKQINVFTQCHSALEKSWENVLTLFSGCSNRCLSPRRRGILKKCDSSSEGRREIHFRDGRDGVGVKGMLPLVCIHRRGREGVTFIAPKNVKKIWVATGFLQSISLRNAEGLFF
jgi:hypothetical protein